MIPIKSYKNVGRGISVFDFDFSFDYPNGRNRLLNKKMLYDFFIDKLESIGFGKYSFCKESIGMLNRLNIKIENCKCNCIY